VNTPAAPYHHGNLRAALVEAGLELARQDGPDAVVVREASRRAGVSHNAAYRHFSDRAQLLKEVCERCMSELARRIEAQVAAVPPGDDAVLTARLRLRATGAAYVEFALAEPGWFRTAFAVPRELTHFGPGEGGGDSGLSPFELLNANLDALTAVGGLPADHRPGAEIVAWSGVHGLATLLIDGPLRGMPVHERRRSLERLLDTVEKGL